MCEGTVITSQDLPPGIVDAPQPIPVQTNAISIPADTTLEQAEKIIIAESLLRNEGNKSKAAEALGIGRKTLHRKLDELKLESAPE
jgi:DNA-binding NtrC family response regulator